MFSLLGRDQSLNKPVLLNDNAGSGECKNISYLKKNTQKGQYSIHLVSLTLVLNSSYSLWSDMLKSQARSKGGKKEPFKKLLHKY
jgi:hypothetical protein